MRLTFSTPSAPLRVEPTVDMFILRDRTFELSSKDSAIGFSSKGLLSSSMSVGMSVLVVLIAKSAYKAPLSALTDLLPLLIGSVINKVNDPKKTGLNIL